jgi:hypothetical protein
MSAPLEDSGGGHIEKCVFRRSGVSTAQLAHLIYDYRWLVPLPPAVWLVLRTPARTVARIFRAAAWSWLLKREGVSAARRRELLDGAAQRDLESS